MLKETNVVELKQALWEELIKELELRLKQAKEGKLRGFVISYQYQDGMSGFSILRDKNCSSYKLLGGLEVAKCELIEMIK